MATMQAVDEGRARAAYDAPTHDRLQRALRRLPVDRPPVWMMRQAGRYLPEFRAVRARADFLTMVRTPELAAEVTVQPVERLGVDAAIVFSDILVVPNAMGMRLRVDEGVGPRFEDPLRSAADLTRLRRPVPGRDLAYTLDAIRLARRTLGGRAPVVGFAGGPWTLAAYMIEGGGSATFATAKRALLADPAFVCALLDRLADAVGAFLCAQVAAGAEVLQLFESAAGALAPDDYRAFALPALARAAGIAKLSGAPLIVFPHGAPWALEEVARATGADAIGVDWRAEPARARRFADALGIAVQGNLDPAVLLASPEVIRRRTREMLRAFAGRGHVANLGHGITPDVPVAHAAAFVDAVREWDGQEEGS